MKSIDMGHRFLSMVVAVVFFLFAVEAFGSLFSYDWDDGTLQGWAKQAPFGGDLGVQTDFGNPGGSMFATDTRGGGVLYARAPGDLSGNQSALIGIYWDEFIPDRRNTVLAPFIILQGTDGTRYASERFQPPEIVTDVWNSRFEPLDDPSAWTRVANSGNATFATVISDLDTLFISMDTSTQIGGVESWIDNFRATPIPIPGSIWLLGTCLAGLLAFKRKFGKKC
jgi:hypothetical protein